MNAVEKPLSKLELWGGIECTVNRVGDRYFDQIAMSGHATRPEDLQQIAKLGIRTLRYPVLWEWTAPDRLDHCNWSWADERLPMLRHLGIRPIAGLVHHGSGPRYTNLLDPNFAQGLASFAAEVAKRYPYLDAFTPVNEPLTTARFSGMYGHWYPHAHEPALFVKALLNQCRAVVLAMEAIRRVRSDAQLIQTEDMGKTHSTPTLRYQADFENERRWVTFDLLRGRVDRQHPMASYFRFVGVDEREWLWFLDHPCPPDILGINHYLTSERYLDDRREYYPACVQGGNGRHTYADVEAVRVCNALTGPAGIVRETWQRYQSPLAITEAHLGCTREEQMRWLLEVWQAAHTVRNEGVDIRAVAVWALLGSHEWNSLVTRRQGYYEPGAFDIRGPAPRPTGLAALVERLAKEEAVDHPVLDVSGWWHQPLRLLYHHECSASKLSIMQPNSKSANEDRLVLITGATGTLGRAFARLCSLRGLPHKLLNRKQMDIAWPEQVELVLAKYKPWAVINAAGPARVDEAERDPNSCFRAHAIGPAVLAEACARRGVALLTFSCDLVFDGRARTPYHESALARPLCIYGQAKAEAELQVLTKLPTALVIRTSSFFGPWSDAHFVSTALRTLEEGRPFLAANDLVVSPTYLPELVHASLDLLIDGQHGIWHLANSGELTWLELARKAAQLAKLDEKAIQGRPAKEFGWLAPRPAYGVLGSERGLLLSKLDDALARYVAEREPPAARKLKEEDVSPDKCVA